MSDAKLRSTSEGLNLAQVTAQIASWEWDLTTGKVFWSGSEWVYGRPAEEVNTPEKCFQCIYPEDLKRFQDALTPAIEGTGEFASEFRVLWPDDSIHWSIGKGRAVSSAANGKAARIVGVVFDITERKLAEKALLQSEKLAAVGRLASSIAHEINNPLEAVTNLIYLARDIPGLVPEVRNYLDTADHELRRISAITSQTLRFHKQATNPTHCTGKALFHETLSVYQGRMVNARVLVEERHRSDLGVLCFEGEIRQVLSNLIANAIDAMPRGGRLLLRTRQATEPRSGQKGITLSVADTGVGMSSAVQSKVFEAFYSTKGLGGTGLGLWVSKEIMDRHSGTLRVRSSQADGASGTVFTLFLPVDAVRR